MPKSFGMSSRFENLRDRWSNLLDQSSRQDIFLTWEWLFAWWRNYGKDNTMRLITIWRGRELVGLAPLMIVARKKYGLTFRILCNFNSPNVDIGGFLFQQDDFAVLELICREILRLRTEWDLIELNGMPAECQEVNLIKRCLQIEGYLMIEDIGQHFIVSLKGTWDDYLKSLSHKFRKDLSRSLRRIREAGEVDYQCFSGKQIKWEHFETIFQINEFGHFPHLYRNPQERDFQKELLELTSNHQWLNIQFLYLQTVPIAYRYGFVFRNRFEAWRNGFDTVSANTDLARFCSR